MTDAVKSHPDEDRDDPDTDHDALAALGAEDIVERPGEAAEDRPGSPASDADAPAPG